MLKRESKWKLLNIVLIIYIVYSVARMVFYGQGTLQSLGFDLARIVLLVSALYWLHTKSEYESERKKRKKTK